MPAEVGSSVPLRQLGRELRSLRERAQADTRVTIEQVMDRVAWKKEKIWRVERGDTLPSHLEVEALCDLYGASQDAKDLLIALCKEARNKAWYHAYGDVIPGWFELYVGLETAASHLSQYDSEVILGLLQTREYARSILQMGAGNDGGEALERKVELRLGRQQRLGNGLKVDLILNEAIIRRTVGNAAIMAEQLEHLVNLSELENVSIRLLPFRAGAHPALAGAFGILAFPNGREPETVYADTYGGGMYLYKPEEVERQRQKFNDLSALALDQNTSRELIAATGKELK